MKNDYGKLANDAINILALIAARSGSLEKALTIIPEFTKDLEIKIRKEFTKEIN